MSSAADPGTLQNVLSELVHRLAPVEVHPESVELADAVGRVLAAPLCADRESLLSDVSSVDDVALRPADPGSAILREGEVVVQAGELISAPTCIALARFGVVRPLVRRPLRVAVIAAGDELDDPEVVPGPARVRDGNGPGLAAALRSQRWIELTWRGRINATRQAITGALAGALRGNDAVLLTGGTSRGEDDAVSAAVEAAGCELVFERLPLAPEERVLAAQGEREQLIIGLPSAPVSTLILFSWLCLPALRKRAGFGRPRSAPMLVEVEGVRSASASRWSFELVRIAADGRARVIASRGPCDIASAARADGFVLVPPGGRGAGVWPFFSWLL